jgi:site-specific DNA recombinase
MKDLAKRTSRDVEERALKGLHTGGRVFGYRNTPIESSTKFDAHGRPVIEAVKLQANPEQAATIRKIFERYAGGHSMKRIAITLNNEGVLSPPPRKGRVSRSWCQSSIRHILLNQRYRGLVIWGRNRKVRSPRTGKKIYECRPESEWRRTEVAEQRIVSEELWNSVRNRMAVVRSLYCVAATSGIRRGRCGAGYNRRTNIKKIHSLRWLIRQFVFVSSSLTAFRPRPKMCSEPGLRITLSRQKLPTD